MESKRYWQWLLMRFAERHVIEGAISLIVVLMTRVPETLKSVLARIWMLVSIIVALIAALFLIRLLSSYRWAGFADKTLWDWLKLLFIPFVLALGAYLLNQAGRLRDQAIEKQREQDAAEVLQRCAPCRERGRGSHGAHHRSSRSTA